VIAHSLVQAFAEWTGERTLLVDQEGHGREDIFDDVDLSRTIGWFTTIFPLLLELEKASHPSDALKAVKDQLRNIQIGGSAMVLRYLSKDVEPLRKPVLFNYLGQSDQVFQVVAVCTSPRVLAQPTVHGKAAAIY